MQPKVSMVMPVYNKINYIDMMLESVFNQRWDDIELIMVNDGATDGTRERLAEWEPKFKARGYEVIIIDQENQGINAAVLAGMKRITGEYFCCVDCDDELDPEYVSKMAGFLYENDDYEFVCCSYQIRCNEKITLPTKPEALPSDPNFLVNYLLNRTFRPSWIYMIRVSYLHGCKIIENFETEPRSCQEDGLIIPLAAGGGKLRYIDIPLYTRIRTGRDSFEDYIDYIDSVIPNFHENIGIHARMAIEKLDLTEKEKKHLLKIQSFGYKISHLNWLKFEYKSLGRKEVEYKKAVEELAYIIDDMFKVDSVSKVVKIMNYDYAIQLLKSSVQNALIGLPPNKFLFNSRGKTVAYGALGERFSSLWPTLKDVGFIPDLLWDRAATTKSSLHDYPVETPDFDSLSAGDILLVIPADPKICDWVRQQVHDPQVEIWRFNDLIEALSTALLPLDES